MLDKLLLVLVILVSACTAPVANEASNESAAREEANGNNSAPATSNTQRAMSQERESDLLALERQLQIATRSGGMSPESYKEIDTTLKELESNSASKERIETLKAMLSQIPVGSESQQVSRPTEQGTGQSQTEQSAPDNSGKTYAAGYTEHPQEECSGTTITFDHAPINLEKIKVFRPLGAMSSNHITPTDHHYFENFDNTQANIEIYSPGKGVVTSIGHMPNAPEGQDYRVVVRHTCTIQSVYIHIHTLSGNLAATLLENPERAYPDLPVDAGEIIGYTKNGVDYNLVDEDVVLTGFAIPDHYSEVWKIHIPDTLQYFNEPVKSRLIEKLVRTKKPLAGKIDYDIDGKLVGNWFLEGSGGYRGTNQQAYWKGHLAIAYEHIDPDRIVLSMGDYDGKEAQYGVKGNSPDPASVEVSSGMVKYELVEYEFYDASGRVWDRRSTAKITETRESPMVKGTVLVQMLEKRKLKFEAFPGKTASQVSGFTSKAKIYER